MNDLALNSCGRGDRHLLTIPALIEYFTYTTLLDTPSAARPHLRLSSSDYLLSKIKQAFLSQKAEWQ